MKSNSTDFRRGMVLTAVMLAAITTAHGQSAPQVQEILNRLDRLEKDNQALLDEIRSLRQELSVLKPPIEPGAQPQQATEERQAVDENRIAELAQTKVEASEKFPIRITGMALFNASVNGRYNGNAENPLVASLTPGDETGDGTLRQSTLGFLFNGPQTFLGGKISGSLFMDFFAGSTYSLNHLVRLRTAAINIDWKNTSIMVGQDKPIISPRDPDSLAQVGYSPLTASGNLWIWQPQIRLEQRFSLGDNTGIRVQAGVFVTSSLSYTAMPSGYTPASPQQEYSWPGTEDRVQLWHHWGDTQRFEIAAGYHFNENRVIETVFPTEVYSVDWFLRPIAKLEFSGMFFHGQNVATLGSLPQGFLVTSERRHRPRPQHRGVGANPGPDYGALGVQYLWGPAGRSKLGSRVWLHREEPGLFRQRDVPHRSQRDRELGGRTGANHLHWNREPGERSL